MHCEGVAQLRLQRCDARAAVVAGCTQLRRLLLTFGQTALGVSKLGSRALQLAALACQRTFRLWHTEDGH